MATSFSDKSPPAFDRNKDNYAKWKKSFAIWQSITDVPKHKQGGHLVLRLDSETNDQVLDVLSVTDLSSDTGAQKVVDELDKIFTKDVTLDAYEAYENFETYKRSSNSILTYIREFQSLYKKVEAGGTTLADHILAYRLINNAQLSERQHELLRATIPKMTYANVIEQLKKIFKNDERPMASGEVKIKEESAEHETLYGGRYKGSNRNSRPLSNKNNSRYDDKRENQYSESKWNRSKSKTRKSNREMKSYKKRGKNPLDQYGRVTRCLNCDSINHWIEKCPDLSEHEHKTFLEQYDVESDCDSDDENTEGPVYEVQHCAQLLEEFHDTTKITLCCETLNTAVLDCGAPKNVCGRKWLEQYITTLQESDKNKIVHKSSRNIFKFGCGSTFPAQEKVVFPAKIGKKKVFIETDVVEGDVPLLFSKESMKKTGASLDFTCDKLQILGQSINLEVTESGHYALPLGPSRQAIIDSSRGTDVTMTLLANNLSPEKMALKLHRQFAHPSAERLVKLVENQGKECKELTKAIREVSRKCKICTIYKRPPPRPVVGLPLATRFNECVAMDLKQFGKLYLFHAIDHTTRLSACSVIRSKSPDVIIGNIFKYWISIYGTPEKILSDNGGEFSNEKVRELGEKMNLRLLTTGAESPWSNGLVERHNLIMGESINKTVADTGCSLDMAVTWCVTAHNSLTNVHGFTPFQLVFGRNPVLPALQTDRPPALNEETVSDLIRKNLNCIHAARQAHIKCESDEKIRRALRHQVRTSGEVRYVTGDRVYYKRMDTKSWKGPAVVLGQDGKQVLVKHQGVYIRVHPCRLTLEQETFVGSKDDVNQVIESPSHNSQQGRQQIYIESDEDTSEKNGEKSLNEQITRNQNEPSDRSEVSNLNLADNGLDKNEDEKSDNTLENKEEQEESSETNDESTIDSDEGQTDSESSVSSDESRTDNENNMNSDKDVAETSGENSKNEDSMKEKDNTNQMSSENKQSRGRPKKNSPKKKICDRNSSLKPGLQVKYKVMEDSEWSVAKLNKRAGKKGGLHENCWNVIDSEGNNKVLDFVKDIDRWELLADTSSQNEIMETLLTKSYEVETSEQIRIAKQKELDSWKKNQVYIEVENKGQEYVTGKWVLKPKVIDGIHSVKARFVLRGYEESKDFRADSPTCMRSSVRLQLAVHSSLGWKLRSIDFKTAFLQGQAIHREVYMRPPYEAETNKLWKLNKTVYGLYDAPRQWYLRLKSIICELGCVLSRLDNGLFLRHENTLLIGMIVVFVDDLLWGGSSEFETTVIIPLKEALHVGSEHSSAFKYLGIKLEQNSNHTITLDQKVYIESLKLVEVSEDRLNNPSDLLTQDERKQLRSSMGQVNWAHSISRPDIGFSAGQISISTKATVKDITEANKLIEHLKNTQTSILFPKLNLKNCYVKVFSDASYANLRDFGSQGGYIIFLTDGIRSCPIEWKSCKVRRVVKSTMAAETLALVDGLEAAFMISQVCGEIINGDDKGLKVVGVTDNKSLKEAAYSSRLLEDRRLMVEISIIRQMINRSEVDLIWVETKKQVSDVLTKTGVGGLKLLSVLSKGRLDVL